MQCLKPTRFIFNLSIFVVHANEIHYPFTYFLFIVSKNIYTLFIAHHISEFLDKQPEYTDFKGH